MRFLMVESETAQAREKRRASVGKSAGESFAATLRQLVPGCEITLVEPADADAEPMSARQIAAFDAVFVGGSPLHVYEDAPEVHRQIAFMREVFASGAPSFGSCAGLQLAVAAAGGQVRPLQNGREVGVARGILPTQAGKAHPLLAGRGEVWDAPAIHSDEVAQLPEGAILLAGNAVTRVQAAEIRCGPGVFWGVQYHPELAPGEIGAALRRDAEAILREGLAADRADLEAQAELFDRLQHDPHDQAARWRLGVGADFAAEAERRLELRNFLQMVAECVASGRAPAEDQHAF
jgi:GMP synthase (glutamine-hydrolysing)